MIVHWFYDPKFSFLLLKKNYLSYASILGKIGWNCHSHQSSDGSLFCISTGHTREIGSPGSLFLLTLLMPLLPFFVLLQLLFNRLVLICIIMNNNLCKIHFHCSLFRKKTNFSIEIILNHSTITHILCYVLECVMME